MQAGIEASRFKGVSGRKSTSSGRMMLWSIGSLDGIACRPDGWQGTNFFDLQTMQNPLKHF